MRARTGRGRFAVRDSLRVRVREESAGRSHVAPRMLQVNVTRSRRGSDGKAPAVEDTSRVSESASRGLTRFIERKTWIFAFEDPSPTRSGCRGRGRARLFVRRRRRIRTARSLPRHVRVRRGRSHPGQLRRRVARGEASLGWSHEGGRSVGCTGFCVGATAGLFLDGDKGQKTRLAISV